MSPPATGLAAADTDTTTARQATVHKQTPKPEAATRHHATPTNKRQSAQRPDATTRQHATPANKRRGAQRHPPPRSTSSTPKTTHNLKSSLLQDFGTTRSTTLNEQGRNNTNTDPNLREKRQREGPESTWLRTAKGIDLLNAWVLISTITMCVCTHHTSPPENPTTIVTTLRSHLPQQSPTMHQQQSSPSLYFPKPHSAYTTLLHTTSHQIAPPPHSRPTPNTTPRSPRSQPPTRHKSVNTKVSKKTGTYQQACTYTITGKTHNTLCINLPQKNRCRRPPPPHMAKRQTPHQIPHPNSTKHHILQAHSLKTEQELPTFLATCNKIHPNHNPLTLTHSSPTTTHPNYNDRHKASRIPQLTHTQRPDRYFTKSNTQPYLTNRGTPPRKIQHTPLPKTDYHIPTLPAIPHSTPTLPKGSHTDTHNSTPNTDAHTASHPGTSQDIPFNRHNLSHKLTTFPTKENRHPPIPISQPDTPQQRPNADRHKKSHPH